MFDTSQDDGTYMEGMYESCDSPLSPKMKMTLAVQDNEDDQNHNVVNFMRDSLPNMASIYESHYGLNMASDAIIEEHTDPICKHAKHKKCKMNRSQEIALIMGLLLGMVVGVSSVWLTLLHAKRNITGTGLLNYIANSSDENETSTFNSYVQTRDTILLPVWIRKPLYVGLLTMDGFRSTRGAACNVTWAQDSYLTEVEMFMASGAQGVTELKGVDSDDYFHVHKTLLVVEQICSRHVADFDWFLLSPDDVYVRIDKLIAFLSQHNPNVKSVFGHGVSPHEDAAYRLLEGAVYCMKGPGIVLSRKTMTGLCSALPRCLDKRHLSDVPADVFLAYCLKEHVGVTCTPQNKLFFDSYEEDSMGRLHQFLDVAEHAMTVHPVKHHYAMQTLHAQNTQAVMARLVQSLETITERRHLLNNMDNILSSDTPADAQTSSGHHEYDDRDISHTKGNAEIHIGDDITLPEKTSVENMERKPSDHKDRRPCSEDIVVYDDVMMTYNSEWCTPSQVAIPSLKAELQDVLRYSNSSLRLGEGLQCPQLISGSYQRHENGTNYDVNLLCKSLSDNNNQHVAVTVKLERNLQPIETKKVRKRKTKNELVFVISTHNRDPKLLLFLMKIQNLMKSNQERCAIYLLLGESNDVKGEIPDPRESPHSARDLQAWLQSSSVVSKVTVYTRPERTRTVQALANDVMGKYPDATVVMTTTNFVLHRSFIVKCKVLARKHKQFYFPYPVISVLTNKSEDPRIAHYMLMGSQRPYCINAADLESLAPPNESILSNTNTDKSQRKQLKVTRAVDHGIMADLLR